MALQNEQLGGDVVSQTPNLRAFPYQDGIQPGKLASYSPDRELPNLTPLFYDDANSQWAVWLGQGSEVNTITSNATPATAGTFTLTVNGQTTAGIAFNATAAIVQAALEALSNVAPGDVVAVATSGANLGVASAVVTLNWGGAYAGQNVTITANMAGLTGNPHVFATSTQGGIAPADGSIIDGFLWAPEVPHTALAAGETLIQVFKMGVIHAADVPVPDGESQLDLNEALLGSSLREKGINLQGLPGIH
jgi:hypothetical protein